MFFTEKKQLRQSPEVLPWKELETGAVWIYLDKQLSVEEKTECVHAVEGRTSRSRRGSLEICFCVMCDVHAFITYVFSK